MKIKILKCCAGLRFSYAAGETVDADDLTAKDLIQAGHAEEVKSGGKGNNPAGGGAGKS
jgi:hypothetical protein